jgi:ribosomal protein S18 acetylase RimI-like enzyme
VNICDWRDAGPAIVGPLYAHARRRWLRELGWDTSSAWTEVEHARVTRGLPGLLVVDDSGQVRGWSFFHPQGAILQVGGLVADTPLATHALLDAVSELSKADGIEAVSCFVFQEAPELAAGLTRRGFACEPFLYLSRDLNSNPPASHPHGVEWTGRDEDVAGIAELLRDAYDPVAASRFTPDHSAASWERYVRNLVERTGLGRFDPTTTRVVRNGSRLSAAVLMTALSSDTAHLAQVAVHPSRRREGLARALVEEACSRAAEAGYRRATLLVGATNQPARGLYEALGFAPCATFVAASLERTARTPRHPRPE